MFFSRGIQRSSITKSYYFDWSGGLAIIHQPASNHNFRVSLLNFMMWSGVVSMFCPGYCHRCVWSYSSNICNGFAFIHAVTCKCHVCTKHVSSNPHHGPQQLSFLPKKPYVSKVWRGKYHLQHHKHDWSKKDHPVTMVFVRIWQQGAHEPAGRNNKTIMFWCVTAIRIKRFQFSESWWVLDGRHKN